ncbi:MAG: hydrolase TatD [wastewater metagenome]|nr:hydrolase TatD [Candidatus Loosdrechtia aerotolerans]
MSMYIIEPHIHMYSRTTDDYQAMYRSGIRVVVEPSFWLGCDRRYAGSFYDYFRLILEFETIRAKRFGIDHYCCISLNPKETENRALVDEVLSGIGEYLDHPRCIGIGEIGLNNITENEIYAFRRQLLFAEERKMPVIVHLPHFNKVKGAQIIVAIVKAEGVNQRRIEIDHNTEETMAIVRGTGCFTGLTVYPYSKLDPQRVSNIIKEFGAERILINGSADWGVSDPLSLPRTIGFLRNDGHREETLKDLFHDNAYTFYSQSPRWDPEYHIEPVPVSCYQRQP